MPAHGVIRSVSNDCNALRAFLVQTFRTSFIAIDARGETVLTCETLPTFAAAFFCLCGAEWLVVQECVYMPSLHRRSNDVSGEPLGDISNAANQISKSGKRTFFVRLFTSDDEPGAFSWTLLQLLLAHPRLHLHQPQHHRSPHGEPPGLLDILNVKFIQTQRRWYRTLGQESSRLASV